MWVEKADSQQTFQVTLLPEDGQAEIAAKARQEVRDTCWKEAVAMLDKVFAVASGTGQQPRFFEYYPEIVLRSVRTLVDFGEGEQLFNLLQERFEGYADNAFARIEQKTATVPEEGNPAPTDVTETDTAAATAAAAAAAYEAYESCALLWKRFSFMAKEIDKVWVYLGRWYVLSRHCPTTLEGLGIQCMRRTLQQHPVVLDRARAGYLAQIREDLKSEPGPQPSPPPASAPAPNATVVEKEEEDEEGEERCPDPAEATRKARHATLRSFTDFLLAVMRYFSTTQGSVVEAVAAQYRSVALAAWQAEVTAADYFHYVESAHHAEKARASAYLHPHTLPLLEEATQRALLSEVGMEVLERDFAQLMTTADYPTLGLILRLLSRGPYINEEPKVRSVFGDYLQKTGAVIMEQLAGPARPPVAAAGTDPFRTVKAMIALLRNGERTIQNSFLECEKDFAVTLHDAIQEVLQEYQQEFSLQLAAYLDFTLKEVETGRRPLSGPAGGTSSSTGATASGDARGGVGGDAGRSSPDTFSSPSSLGLQTATRGGPRGAANEEEEDDSNEEREEQLAVGPSPTAPGCGTLAGTATATSTTAAAHGTPPQPAPRDEEQGEEEEEGVKGSTAGSAPLSADVILNEIGAIFTYHPSKDLFEAFYWRDLSRRLLHPYRTARFDAEERFVQILKSICGASFTAKFEVMMEDVRAVDVVSAAYHTFVASEGQQVVALPGRGGNVAAASSPTGTVASGATGTAGAQQTTSSPGTTGQAERPRAVTTAADFAGLPKQAEVRVHFLTSEQWPKFTPLPLVLPGSWQRLVLNIELFYRTVYRNRLLVWHHQLSHGVLLGQLQPNTPPRQFSGTAVQCAILLLMDAVLPTDADSTTVGEVCARLGVDLEQPEVMGAVLGLCHDKFRLLLREAGGAATATATEASSSTTGRPTGLVAVTDRVRFNSGFTARASKVRIPFQTRTKAAEAAADEELRWTTERVIKERGYLLDVAVVRYMKAHREVKHDTLIAELPGQLRFPVTTAAIKKTVERLIDRGFIGREHGSEVYKYIS